MTRLAVQAPDAERLVVDYLEPLIDDAEVGVQVPAEWESGVSDTPHLQVALDGTPRIDHPVTHHATVRLTARAKSTTEAKELAARAQGLLCAHPGGGGIASTTPLTGVLPARDPQTNAEIASTTTRVIVRSTEIEPSGS